MCILKLYTISRVMERHPKRYKLWVHPCTAERPQVPLSVAYLGPFKVQERREQSRTRWQTERRSTASNPSTLDTTGSRSTFNLCRGAANWSDLRCFLLQHHWLQFTCHCHCLQTDLARSATANFHLNTMTCSSLVCYFCNNLLWPFS